MNTLLIALGIFVGISFFASILVLSAMAVSGQAGDALDEPGYGSRSSRDGEVKQELVRDRAVA